MAIKFQLASELFFCDSSFFSSKQRRCDSITSDVPSAWSSVGGGDKRQTRKNMSSGEVRMLVWYYYMIGLPNDAFNFRTVLRHTTRESIINRQKNLGLVQGNNPASVRRCCSNVLEVCQERRKSSVQDLNLPCHEYEAGASKTRRRYSVFTYY